MMRLPGFRVSRLLVSALAISAATIAARAADFGFDHVHLAAPDPVVAVDWYQKYIGGDKVEGQTDRLKFGTTLLIFQRAPRGEMKGSEGSAVDHIGFSLTDLAAKMKTFETAGIKIVQPVKEAGGIKSGFIADPWGTKLELVEDKDTLGFHHVRLRGQNPKEILDWYQKTFGGERKQFQGADALKYGTVWVLADSSGQAVPEATAGRSLDHVGWMIPKLDEVAVQMKASGIKFTSEPRDLGRGTSIRIAFIEGPGGVKIELVQR